MKKLSFVFTFLAILFVGIFLTQEKVSAYGECSQYGIMASYDVLTNTCKCMSGYVFSDDFLGNPECVSCSSKYGYGATADYLNGGCKCMSGYTLGKDSLGKQKCVSLDSVCTDQLGYNSRYSSLYDRCECSYGYVIDNGRCTDGNMVCHSKHGFDSSYNSLSNRCECDDGYTLDSSSQCVKKQNNVYFLLEALDLNNRKAIIKSDYDNMEYLVDYGIGCLSIENYVDRKLVINLGIDFDLDAWDKIVLQNNDQTCNIVSRERTFGIDDICDDGYILEDNECVNKPVVCPPNSSPVGNLCYCSAGYRWNLGQTDCVRIQIKTPTITLPNSIVKEKVKIIPKMKEVDISNQSTNQNKDSSGAEVKSETSNLEGNSFPPITKPKSLFEYFRNWFRGLLGK